MGVVGLALVDSQVRWRKHMLRRAQSITQSSQIPGSTEIVEKQQKRKADEGLAYGWDYTYFGEKVSY